jgi:hypothetical protein
MALSALFIKVYTSQHAQMGHNRLFFQLCLEHLGFLVTDNGFEVQCEHWDGPDSYAQITFLKSPVRISIVQASFCLPKLLTCPTIDASAVAEWCGFDNTPKNYQEAFSRAHPLDALEHIYVAREFEDATIQRIRQFGACLRENWQRL